MKKDHPEDGEELSGAHPRPVVVARAAQNDGASVPAAPAVPGRGVPIQMSGGRLPDGGQGANGMIKMKSIFEGSGQAPQQNAVPIARPGAVPLKAGRDSGRPLVIARPVMGQESAPSQPAAPAPVPARPVGPPTKIEEVIIRESGPEGLTRREASDFAMVLEQAIVAASEAITAGETCIGVDGATIQNAKELQAGLERFATLGNPDERLNLRPGEIATMKSVLECGMTHQRLEQASQGRVMAFVIGGLIVGAVVLLTK